MATKKNEYSPLMFLAALGSGGLSVSFFMYLMFMTEHKGFPIPTFNTLIEYFYYYNDLSLGTGFSVLITLSLLGVVFFAFKHFTSLIFNIKGYLKFRKTKKFEKIKQSNDEVILMTIPLTFAMSINVLFMLGALFVPGLWNYVEYLFSFAIIGFMIIGYFAIKIFLDYFTRLLTVKSFDFVGNNTLGQMLSVFAFTMVGVGFAAPAAMSTNTTTIAISLVFSIFFITIAIFFSILKIILGFKSILKEGIAKEASPTLWMLIPILTLIGISFVRQQHGLHEGFNLHLESGTLFTLTTSIISLQIIFGVIGYKVMKMNNYFKDYLNGDKKSPGSFALICPGVALVVFGFFFLHLGFVKNDIINQFSIIYIILLLPLIFLQYKTINTLLKLENKFFKQK